MGFKALNAGMGFTLSLGLAMILGADSGTDALLIALFIPVVIGQSLIPLISMIIVPVMVQEEDEGASHLPPGVGGIVLTVTLVTGALVFAFPQAIVSLMGPGLNADSVNRACDLVRILIPALVLISMFGLSQSYFYANKHFYRPELGRFTWRAVSLLGLVTIGPSRGVTGYAWCVLGASFLQLMFVFPGPFFSREFCQVTCPRHIRHRLTKAFLTVGTSAVLGWTIQLCIRSVSSLYGKGVLTIVDYSDRLAQFIPLLMARSFFTLLLPDLATIQKKGETGSILAGYVGLLLFLMGVPLAGFIYFITPDISRLLCDYSKIPRESMDTLTFAIRGFTLGIPAVLGHMSLKGVFLVARKIRATALIEIIHLISFGAALIVLYRLGPWGITTSVSISSWIVLLFLYKILSLSLGKKNILRTGAGTALIFASTAIPLHKSASVSVMITITSFLLYIVLVRPVWTMCIRQLKEEYHKTKGVGHVP